jgi:excisionase family DNA binding protein
VDAAETEPEYITAEDVAAMLKVSAKTVYRLAREDASLPQLRIGGSVRFPRERLMKWLRAREGAPVAERPAARHDAPAATGRGQRTPSAGG